MNKSIKLVVFSNNFLINNKQYNVIIKRLPEVFDFDSNSDYNSQQLKIASNFERIEGC